MILVNILGQMTDITGKIPTTVVKNLQTISTNGTEACSQMNSSIAMKNWNVSAFKKGSEEIARETMNQVEETEKEKESANSNDVVKIETKICVNIS